MDVTDQTLTTIPFQDGDGSEMIGHTIDGRYQIEATLGRGGMGLVYRATHVTLRRRAAVKILHPALVANTDVRTRFEREALASGKIRHDNCVQVYDSGYLTDGSMYLAMELLEGESLADVLQRNGQLPVPRALHILAHVLRGLAHIHAAGLIHRDIKPENIFLVKSGDDPDFAKILDFGIAKPMRGELTDDGVKLTQAGMAFGTPIYMAPEQALGNRLDGRADVYAAAVVGYEMLAGNPPFYSDDKLEVMSMHTAKPVPPIRHKLSKGGKPVPASIERLIVRGLTKKPQDRYDSADAMLAAVEAVLATKDGGNTDVQFERVDDTGSQPLVSDSGKVQIVSSDPPTEEEPPTESRAAIGEAIDEVLARSKVPRRPSTPGRGTAAAVSPTKTPGRGVVPQPSIVPSIALPAPTSPFAPPPPVNTQQLFQPPLPAPPLLPLPPPQPQLVPPELVPRASPPPPQAARAPTIDLLTSPPPPIQPTPWRARLPQRWKLYGGVVAAAVAVGVIIAVATSRHGRSDLAAGHPAYARDAYASVDRGEVAQAQQQLDANRPASQRDPLALLVQGLIDASTGDNRRAVDAYRATLRADAALGSDPKLRASLEALAGGSDRAILADALDMWCSTGDPAAVRALDAAVVAVDDLARHDAGTSALARHPELAGKVDQVVALAIDVQAADTCEKRKAALHGLQDLHDARAMPVIDVVRRDPRNRCLANDAAAVLAALRGQPK
jgi:serine/threonine protein kinase